MSRIGKKPIEVPPGVEVQIHGRTVTVTGPRGSLTLTHRPEVRVLWDQNEKRLRCQVDGGVSAPRQVRAYWGLTRALLQNMVTGVTRGFERALEINGVGYSAALEGRNLKLALGFSQPVVVPVPQGLDVSIDRQLVTIRGADRQQVGQFAALVRSIRPPEPYKGKGVRYVGEFVRRKQGKQFGA